MAISFLCGFRCSSCRSVVLSVSGWVTSCVNSEYRFGNVEPVQGGEEGVVPGGRLVQVPVGEPRKDVRDMDAPRALTLSKRPPRLLVQHHALVALRQRDRLPVQGPPAERARQRCNRCDSVLIPSGGWSMVMKGVIESTALTVGVVLALLNGEEALYVGGAVVADAAGQVVGDTLPRQDRPRALVDNDLDRHADFKIEKEK